MGDVVVSAIVSFGVFAPAIVFGFILLLKNQGNKRKQIDIEAERIAMERERIALENRKLDMADRVIEDERTERYKKN